MARLFPHERLLAYQRAREFYRQVIGFRSRMFRGLGDLYDQLLRASSSICLNLAEGASSYTPGSKLRHFRIALSSAGECACALDQLEDHRVLGDRELVEARGLLTEAAALTVGLIRRLAEPQDLITDKQSATEPSSTVG
jgi:four helix bundle protein